MDKKCVVIDVDLAVVLGVSESIIIQQMSYWLEKSTHIIEGRPWIFNSYASWQKQLPFFCESTIRRLIKKLEDMEIILSANFNKCKMDKTKWYSINYDALNELSEKLNKPLNNSDNDNSDAEGNDLRCANNEQMDESTDDRNCSNLAVDEINLTKAIPEITPETTPKDVVVVEKGARPLGFNSKGLAPKVGKTFEDIINFFSSNLHLPTPYEHEKLRLLYEDLKGGDLIIKAMEIAVENRVRTFRYIESILYNWMDLDLYSLSAVDEYMQSYKESHKNQRMYLENKVSAPEVIKERKDDNHGGKKYSKCGDRQYSSYNKKAQGKVQGKYAGFKPEEPELPEFNEEDFAEFI